MKKSASKGFYIFSVIMLFVGAALPAHAQFSGVPIESGGLYTALTRDLNNNLYVTRVTPGTAGATYEVERYANGTGSPFVFYTGLTHETGDYPWGLAVTGNGNVYISTDFTSGGGSIIKLSYNSGNNTYTSSTFQTGRYFTALAVDAAGNLYDTEYDAAHTTYAVVKYAANSAANSAGTVLYDNLKTGPGYAYPTGLAIAANGDVYVADAFSNSSSVIDGGHIYKLTASSAYAATIISAGTYCSALAFDASGNLFSSENSGSGYKLLEYPAGGGASSVFFSPMHTNAIYYPWGIAILNNANVFAIDGDDGTHGGEVMHLLLADALLSSIKLTPSSALVNTGTTGTTTTFTTSVSNATTSVKVTATTVDPKATITVNGIAAMSGSASGSIALAVGDNTINTVVTAEDGITTHTYSIIVTRVSTNALLSTIKLTPASTLTNTGTVGTTTTYTTSVPNATTSVTVTATASDPNATIKVNGAAVTSGTASGPIALGAEGGITTITTVVTAQDGTTTRTYSIAVTRAPSNNATLSAIKLTPFSQLTNTGTVGNTTTYTASVSNATTSVTVTPTVQDVNATVKVNGTTVVSGAASGPIGLPVGNTTINTVVTAQDGTTTRTYSITVTRISSDAFLSSIKLTPASTLTNAGTDGSTTTYTASVSNATTSVTVTPTAIDPNAAITVNGITVASGTASGSIPLAVGENAINTVVTASDGVTTWTYIIIVTRISNNALLSSIQLTPASTLTNTGTVGSTTTYTTSVGFATAAVTVTPTTADPNATVTVNGAAVTSGTSSGSIALAEGANTTITTIVTAQDGTTTHTYSIIVTRGPSNNALLSSIKLTPFSTLTNTGTVRNQTRYTTSVSNATTSVTVTPTTQDPNATVTVNGTPVTSGTASGSIALAVGDNTITTRVVAQDGVTVQIYLITVTRASGPLMSLYQSPPPISVVKPAAIVSIENDGILVHEGVSPNGDGINDVLTIDGITAYPDNNLTIIDRNGALVYQAKGYDNASKNFDGHSSVDGKMQQPGTYFYSLNYTVKGQNRNKTGYIILKY